MSVATAKKKHPRKSSSSLKVVKKNDSLETVPSTVPVPVDNSPDNMIMIALKANRPMSEIKELIDMRNAEISRIAELEFTSAMTKFMSLRSRIVKKNEADFGVNSQGRQGAKYKFEDLDAIELAVKDAAAECGLTYNWNTRYDGEWIYIKCILSHIGGHSKYDEMRGKADLSGGKNAIQAEASTISYLMRYTLKKVLGLSTGKDDNDGTGGAKVSPIKVITLEEPTAATYKILCDSVAKGTMTIDQIEKTYKLTDERLETLRTLKQ